jgi:hypothetical protein
MFGLKGKVKSFYEKHYKADYKFDEWSKGEIKYQGHYKVLFSSNGDYNAIEHYNYEAKLIGKLVPKRRKNKIIQVNYYDETGGLITRTEISYISKSESSYISYNDGGEKTASGKNYIDNNGRNIKFIYEAEEDKFTITSEYNSDGLLIKQIQRNENDELISFDRFEYLEFDNNGNWIKKLGYTDEEADAPELFIVREIEYY